MLTTYRYFGFFVQTRSKPANSPACLLLTTSPQHLWGNCFFRVGLGSRISLHKDCFPLSFTRERDPLSGGCSTNSWGFEIGFGFGPDWQIDCLVDELKGCYITPATLSRRLIKGTCFLDPFWHWKLPGLLQHLKTKSCSLLWRVCQSCARFEQELSPDSLEACLDLTLPALSFW